MRVKPSSLKSTAQASTPPSSRSCLPRLAERLAPEVESPSTADQVRLEVLGSRSLEVLLGSRWPREVTMEERKGLVARRPEDLLLRRAKHSRTIKRLGEIACWELVNQDTES